jgi:hypothetical protein
VRTNAGRDLQAALMADPASNATGAYAPANWMGISTNATPEDPTRTTLPGELTGGSMGRSQSTYSHTAGTTSYTLIRTWVADRQVQVTKFAVFNAVSGGVMMFEKLLDEAVPLKAGDSFQIVHTVSI